MADTDLPESIRIVRYLANGEVQKDFTVNELERYAFDTTDGLLDFFAHQNLHVEDVTCVAIYDDDDDLLLRQCDPGLLFEDVVGP